MYPPLVHILTLVMGQSCPQFSLQTTAGANCGIIGQAGALGWGLSENGTICGERSKCNSDKDPFFRLAGGPVVTVTEAGAADIGLARAVNSSGTVVGHVDTSALSFVYQSGAVTWLQPLATHNVTEALSVNDAGRIVGFSIDLFSFDGPQAVLWNNDQAHALNLPVGPGSIAEAVNGVGKVCGWMGQYSFPPEVASPFIWHDGVTTALPLPAKAAFNTGAATGINNLGDACGYYFIFDRKSQTYVRQGCAWIDGELIELATLPGLPGMYPLDINDAREIVGYCTDITGNDAYPFVWRDGVTHSVRDMIPPPPLGQTTLGVARGINNKGQIVGSGVTETDDDSFSVAYLLTPAPPQHPGDVNCDSVVNVTDLLAVIATWDPVGPVGGRPADLNRDNRIDVFDLIETILHWG